MDERIDSGAAVADESERRLQAVLDIVGTLTTDAPIEEMVRRVGGTLQQLIPCDRFSLGLFWLNRWFFLEDGTLTSQEIHAGRSMDEGISAARWVVSNRQALLRQDIVAERRFDLDDELIEEGIRADLIVPLLAEGRVIGTFHLSSRTPAQHGECDLETARIIAEGVAAVVKQLQDRFYLRGIQEISEAVQGSLDLKEVLRMVLHHIRSQGYDRVRIFLYDEQEKVLRGGMQSGGQPAVPFEDVRLPLDEEHYSRRSFAQRRVQISRFGEPGVGDSYTRIFPEQPFAEKADLPLFCTEQGREKIVGKISLDNGISRMPLVQERLDGLMLYAAQAAIAIRHAQIYQKLEELVASRTYGLQRQADYQEALLQIGRAVQSIKRPDDLAQLMQILDARLRQLDLNFRILAIHRLQGEDRADFESYEAKGEVELNRSVKTHELLFRIWKAGRTIYRADMEKDLVDLHADEFERLCKRYGMRIRSMLDVPYSRGVLALMSSKADAFSPSEIHFVEQISEILTVGISRVEDIETIETSRRELQESEERFRRLADSSFEGIIISENGRVVDVNRQFVELYGGSAEELIGIDVTDMVAQESRALIRRNMARDFEQPYEVVGMRRDGSTFPVEVHARTLAYGARRLRVAAVRDITEHKKALDRQINLERLGALGEMAQGVAHNFNNIMVGVLGYAQLIRMQVDDPKLLEDVEQVISSAERARELVRRLNLSVRGERDRMMPVPVVLTIKDAIDASSTRWRDEAESRGVAIAMDARLDEVPPIEGNRSRLYDILINLIFNAVDALEHGGTIVVAARKRGDEVELQVTDDGIGMDEETRRRAFEPFFTTKAYVGTGLGLSTVYNTVVQWGGKIEIESEPGRGTTVTMRFPACAEKWEEVEERAIIREDAATGGRILIVDDDETVVSFLRDALSMEHHVETADSGEEALERFAPEEYQVVLIDLGMPGMPGDRVATEMRRIDPAISTVLATGWELEQEDPRMVHFDFLLLKPFRYEQVEKVIGQALGLHARRASGQG